MMEIGKEDFKAEAAGGIARTASATFHYSIIRRLEATLEVRDSDALGIEQLPSLSDSLCGQPNMRSPASM